MGDCTAGLAREHAAALWQHLSEHGPAGIELPTLCYQTCAEVFDALGEPDTSRAAVEAGYRDLLARAEKVSDPEWLRSFLDNIPEHRAVIELWERRQAVSD